MRAPFLFLALSIGLVGCGTPEGHGSGGVMDMSVVVAPLPDLAKPPAKCAAMDTLTDGQPCSAGCTSNQNGVQFLGSCKCFQKCDTNNQATCPCDRFCDPLTNTPDGGDGSGACLPGNTAGERCFKDANGMPYGNGLCQQGLACVRTDAPNQPRYCLYLCFGSNADCPAQTECDPLMDNTGHTFANVCNPLHGTNGKGIDMPCVIGTDTCLQGLLCDGTTCKTMCDGPNATCAAGAKCTAVTDGMRTVGYVCK